MLFYNFCREFVTEVTYALLISNFLKKNLKNFVLSVKSKSQTRVVHHTGGARWRSDFRRPRRYLVSKGIWDTGQDIFLQNAEIFVEKSFLSRSQ